MRGQHRRPTWTLLLFALAAVLLLAGPVRARPSMSAAGADAAPAVMGDGAQPAIVEAPARPGGAAIRSREDVAPVGPADQGHPDQPAFPHETAWLPEGGHGLILEEEVSSRRGWIREVEMAPRLPGDRSEYHAAIAGTARGLGYRWMRS